MARPTLTALVVAVLLAMPTVITLDAQSADPIRYTLRFPAPHTHYVEVEAIVPTARQAAIELYMAVWTPGSYLVREFARNVQDFAALDAAGQPLKWEKINKDTWRVVTNGAREWHARYRVYANETSVSTSELNSSHAFWNNANILMYLDGFLKSPSTVHVLAPDVWKVATGLPAVLGQKNTFRAENFDVTREYGSGARRNIFSSGLPSPS